MAKTNPNGVNQYTEPDPRQALFLNYYLDRESETFANALESAKKAGFTEEYGKVLVSHMPKWLSDTIRDRSIVQKAERNLNEFLDDDKNINIKADMTKFALKGLQKEKYAEKNITEDTKKVEITIKDEEFKKIINGYKNSSSDKDIR